MQKKALTLEKSTQSTPAHKKKKQATEKKHIKHYGAFKSTCYDPWNNQRDKDSEANYLQEFMSDVANKLGKWSYCMSYCRSRDHLNVCYIYDLVFWSRDHQNICYIYDPVFRHSIWNSVNNFVDTLGLSNKKYYEHFNLYFCFISRFET